MTANEDRLRRTLERLGDLRTLVVLVGGASTQLLITDPAAAPLRPTDDVDVIVDRSAQGIHALEAGLRQRGFTQRPELADPICRWRHGDDVVVDVMPTDGQVFGFSNRWYRLAWDTATVRVVAGYELRVVTATAFVATKLDAFEARGGEDYALSEDLEDIVAVVDGRNELVAEIGDAPPALRAYLIDRIGRLLAEPRFVDAVLGHLGGDDGRLAIVLDRLRSVVAHARS